MNIPNTSQYIQPTAPPAQTTIETPPHSRASYQPSYIRGYANTTDDDPEVELIRRSMIVDNKTDTDNTLYPSLGSGQYKYPETTNQPIQQNINIQQNMTIQEENISDNQHLYKSILDQINIYLKSKNYIISEWKQKTDTYEIFVWNPNNIFFGQINVLFINEQYDDILPYSINVCVNTYHNNKFKDYVITKKNNTFSSQFTIKLNNNFAIRDLCSKIYRVITPKSLLPRKKMTFNNILDGSYFVSYS